MKILGKFLRVIVALMFIAAGVLILIGLYKFGTILGFFLFYPWLLSKILSSVDINYHLAEIIAILSAGGICFGAWKFYRKYPGYVLGCIVLLMVAQSSYMFFSERNRFYSFSTGQPIKYYTINPLSGEIQVFDRAIYDALGQKAQPVNFKIAKEIYRQKNVAKFPNDEVSAQSIKNFFDPMSGKALVYYCQNKEGYHFYLHEGFDPKTGRQLIPVTSQIVETLNLQSAPESKPASEAPNSAASLPDKSADTKTVKQQATLSRLAESFGKTLPKMATDPAPEKIPSNILNDKITASSESNVRQINLHDLDRWYHFIYFVRSTEKGYQLEKEKDNIKKEPVLVNVNFRIFDLSNNLIDEGKTSENSGSGYANYQVGLKNFRIYWTLDSRITRNTQWHHTEYSLNNNGKYVVIYVN